MNMEGKGCCHEIATPVVPQQHQTFLQGVSARCHDSQRSSSRLQDVVSVAKIPKMLQCSSTDIREE